MSKTPSALHLSISVLEAAMALAAYRHLLRAFRVAFHEDTHLLHAARSQARIGFDDQSSLDPSSAEATKAIAHAEGVADVLRHNVVQGVRSGKDKLSMSPLTFVDTDGRANLGQNFEYTKTQREETTTRSKTRWFLVERSRLEVFENQVSIYCSNMIPHPAA